MVLVNAVARTQDHAFAPADRRTYTHWKNGGRGPRAHCTNMVQYVSC